MREIYKPYSLKGKKQTKTTTFSIALLVAATMILGSALPVFAVKTNTTKLNEINDVEFAADPTGLDPNWVYKSNSNPQLSSIGLNKGPQPIAKTDTMYGFNAYGGSSGEQLGPCYWLIEDPGDVTSLAYYGGQFLAGGTWTCDEKWLACQYGNGILFEIDPETGDCTAIGGGGTGCHGLAWDPMFNRLYGTSGTVLIEYDPDTGEQEQIGSHGQAGKTMIALAINLDGECYGWDVLFSGETMLWSIDLESGEAEVYDGLGEPLVYAQDGAFDWETGILWFSAYFSTGFEAYYDFDTGEFEHFDNFEGGMEITASMIQAQCIPPEHDVQVKSIDDPDTGPAVPNMPMKITVKNSGNNTETFNAQMEVIKCETGDDILYEDFSGSTFPPEGWETDYWKQSNTNQAGGTAPEARVYKYDYGGQTYDNYLMTPPIDCTGLEKVNLKFKYASDMLYPQYCSFYIKFRRNSTSPWKDVTPWSNPIGSNQDAEYYEIGCYGFGEPMGDEFQMMFQYLGYYYYFNYFWIDDVALEACGGCAEYAELIEFITLDAGEEMQLTFPGWPPSEWQNESSENTWEEYPIHAWVYLEGDQNPRNDNKWKLIDLWYPWLHDISLSTIDSPYDPDERWIPGQTFPVVATMFNAGQYPECCIPIEVMIGEPVVLETLFEEYDWPGSGTYYPGQYSGWTDEHKQLLYYYGWWRYNSNYAGGTPYEARSYYYYARADYVFYSMAIDTSAYAGVNLEFLSYVNHYSGQGLYTLEAGYSFDAKEWYAAWSVAPGSSQGWEVSVPIEGGHDTMYIGFWVKGNPYYYNYWYVDNVKLVATGLIEEFTDTACQGPDIEPGEYVTFEFDDWTPAFLELETTGEKEYVAQANIFMEGDRNPGNDILTQYFICKFWHDVGIDAVTSPVAAGGKGDILYDNGLPDGRNGCYYGSYYGYETILIDDFENDQQWTVNDAQFRMCWNSGAGPGGFNYVDVIFYKDEDDCDPSTTEFARERATSINDWLTGDVYYGRPELAVDIEFDDVVLTPGKWWVGFYPQKTGDNDFAAALTSEVKNCEAMGYSTYFGWSKWTSSSIIYGDSYDFAWLISGESLGPPGINVYIQPGTEDIEALVKNYGTFPERDLICYAQVKEFLSDPLNGSEIMSGEIGPFNLMTPLGGTKSCDFGSVTFPDEGRYGAYFQIPDDDDDEGKNNKMKWGIGVDDTAPKSNSTVTPSKPDGLNGWYVNDVEILLQAADPMVAEVSSGVREIRYTINGGAEKVIQGSSGTFALTEDGNDIRVEFWAVDNVGNVEAKKTVTPLIDMDQTPPAVESEDFYYEVVGGNPYQGWDMLFTMNATDAMSGMDRVEFYLNNVLQETVSGSGPVYQWEFRYWPLPKVTIKATAFDVAGNSIYLEIEDPETTSRSAPHQHSSNNTPRGRPQPR